MKPHSLILAFVCTVPLLVAQTAQKPASAPQLTGFPFQNETLRYTVNWPSGLALGEVDLSARRVESGWAFDASIDAGVPAFAISDRLHSEASSDLCTGQLVREINHAGHKTKEKTTFDFHNLSAHRETLVPAGGGTSDFSIPACPRDVLAFFYFMRQELGQGRVAQPASAYFGAAYNVELHYTGEMTIPVNGQPTVTDLVVASIKGPKSDVQAEMYFARDAARTPLVIKLPLSMGTFSLELVR
ncbi:MAG TPA: DUF3108 domain-containing protein [Bryobacteraceae bacterium]|nr:DUF3108 domain-containing protein [Bryobacteraceae bacterium]